MNRRLLLLAVSVVALLGVPISAAAMTGTAAHAYDASAVAVPVDPQVGSHDSPIPVRLFPTRADVSNPPAAASARAARTDLGLLEQFVPPQALGPAADASTVDQGSKHRANQQDGTADYSARVSDAPYATATATGQSIVAAGATVGGMTSTSYAGATARRVFAGATTTLDDVRLGPVHIRHAEFEATAAATQHSGGAVANGTLTVVGATVAGVPVVVTQDGVQVDSTKIPARQVDQATAAVAAGFARSGYFDVRLVQPVVVQRKDGSAASVTGGGLQLIGRSDKQSTYFINVTLLSGSVQASIGDRLDDLTPPGTSPSVPVPPVPPSIPSTPGGALGPPYSPLPAAGGLPPTARNPQTPSHHEAVLTSRQAGDASLPGIWSGWPVLLASAAAFALAWGGLLLPPLTPVRRRLQRARELAADRYLRG